MNKQDKLTLQHWHEFKKAACSDAPIDSKKTKAQREKERLRLEQDPVEWCRFFFPNYTTSEFARFHKEYIKRIVENPEWYEVVSWSRELGKDTVTMMAMMYLNLTGKKKFTIFVSSSFDAAYDLLKPYMLNFESNPRIKAYYGEQKNIGSWENGDFTTKNGVRYVALGAGQSPRGKKNEALRPDSIICSDLDTDADCKNPGIIEKRFKWLDGALRPTRSISKPLLFLVLGNIIAKDCCVLRCAVKADRHDIVNIRDKNGKSSWIEKNSEAHIDRVLATMSTAAAQAEYFNNPLSEGCIFKELKWGKCPPLQKLKYAIVYADPSTSNKDKQKKGASYKAAWLIGFFEGNFYIYKGFLDQVNNATFVQWFYDLRDYVGERTFVYNYIENNSLQDPFFEQVFKPMFASIGKEKGYINITPDARKKPDKFIRIEGNLEPLSRTGKLIFNIDEQNDPNMQRLAEQFLLIDPQMKAPADGPDAVEGGVWILNNKATKITVGDVAGFGRTKKGKNRI